MSEDNQLITRQDDAGVARLTLNQPRSINALSEAMLLALQSMLDDIAKDRTVRVVILSGAGDHFCAGHNLKEMTAAREQGDGGYDYFQALFATCSRMMQTIVELPQPVIAEVSGIATAAGCQLVATCDLAVAAEDARFATSGVTIGLFCSTPMVALTRNLSRKHAMEMLLLGEFIPRRGRLRWGSSIGLYHWQTSAERPRIWPAASPINLRQRSRSGKRRFMNKHRCLCRRPMPTQGGPWPKT